MVQKLLDILDLARIYRVNVWSKYLNRKNFWRELKPDFIRRKNSTDTEISTEVLPLSFYRIRIFQVLMKNISTMSILQNAMIKKRNVSN